MEHSGAPESLWVYKSWGCLCVSGAGGDKWNVGRVQRGGRVALSLFPVADPGRKGEKGAGDWRDKGEFKIPKSQVCLYIEGMEPVEREGCGFRRTKAWDTGRG